MVLSILTMADSASSSSGTIKTPGLLIQMSGMPGSGKSTLARLLRASLGGVVIDHDVLRSALLEDPTDTHFDQVAKQAYGLQWAVVEDMMKQGLHVIVDSTCNYQEVLDRGLELAGRYGFTYWYVECRVEDIDVLDERLRTRTPMRSQRTGVDCPPAAAVSARVGQDTRALFKRTPFRPDRNTIMVDSTANLETHWDCIVNQILKGPNELG